MAQEGGASSGASLSPSASPRSDYAMVAAHSVAATVLFTPVGQSARVQTDKGSTYVIFVAHESHRRSEKKISLNFF